MAENYLAKNIMISKFGFIIQVFLYQSNKENR